jgi:hypothetical protein
MNQRVIADPSQHGWVEVDGKWVWDAESGGAGAGMVISETEPTDKVEGMQWLNPTTGLVLFWDDEKWLQMPTTGAAGKDGVDGLWTDEGDGSISYSSDISVDGNATFTGSVNLAGGGLKYRTASNITLDSDAIAGYLAVGGAEHYSWNATDFRPQTDAQYDLGASNATWKDGFFSGAVYVKNLAVQNKAGGAGGTLTVNGDLLAAKSDAGADALAVGYQAGLTNQGADAVAVGNSAGYNTQQKWAVAIGPYAGYSGQKESSISIGYKAGDINQPANSVIISATGTAKNVANPNCVWIGGNDTKRLYYNGTDEWSFAGGILKVDGVPVTTSTTLIKTLATLRKATMDETQDIRESLRSAIDELVAGFEQEIATMPAPEVSTQEIADE